MNAIRNFGIVALLGIGLAACSANNDDSVFRYISVLDDARIAVHAHSAPDAIVSAAGELKIDGKNVAVTPAQKDSLMRYYAIVMALRQDAIATGKAGANTAATAIGSVISGIANGDPNTIGDKVDAQAAKVDAAAAQVCKDLSAIQTAQGEIAGQLAVFKPYALIDARQVQDCEHG
jgi:hypothetical protein